MVTATCHSKGCLNFEQPIVITEIVDYVVCGPCGELVTDIKAV